LGENSSKPHGVKCRPTWGQIWPLLRKKGGIQSGTVVSEKTWKSFQRIRGAPL